jgi:hypothetical protein
MTPQEINDHKMKWMRESNHSVRLHSDLDVEGKDWCRKNLERHQWSFSQYSGVYEHTFHFESQAASQQFAQEFHDWVQGDTQ